MARRKCINERTGLEIDVTHINQAGVNVAPTAVTWFVNDITNNRKALDDQTIVTPTKKDTISVSAAVNQIHNTANDREIRQLVVIATGTGEPTTSTIEWEIENVLNVGAA